MWILNPVASGGEAHYLFSAKEYVVGRKNCDILLPSDQSISRAHAYFVVTDETLTLRDASKYGTAVNGQTLAADTPVTLKSGDSVTFGVFESKFSVNHLNPVVCSSCLDNDGKAALSQALQLFGGKLVSSWTKDCTHLVMPSVKVTIKTISALLCCCPIVKPEFFSELKKAAQQKLPAPKAERFIPDIDEPYLNNENVNLKPDHTRKQLFAGTTFVFLTSKQFKRLSAAVSYGGGTSQLLVEGSLPLDLLESPQSCVVDFTAVNSQPPLLASTTGWHDSVRNIILRKGLRVITESEIGLAVIYTSRDMYCNPTSVADKATVTTARIPSASLSQYPAVDETVLPAASQNITAYAINTETSQIHERCEVSGITAVGETPEKKMNHDTTQPSTSKATVEKISTQCIAADFPSKSFNTTKNAVSTRKEPAANDTGPELDKGQLPLAKYGSRKKTLEPKNSPRKQVSPKASPQKQAALTSFFKPVNKKRPLEDVFSAVMSEAKRPVHESDTIQAAVIPVASEDSPSCSDKAPSQLLVDSENDLFFGQASSSNVSRKRKDVEKEIDLDELESIMSEEMDCMDEPFSVSKPTHRTKQIAKIAMGERKKQRVVHEDDDTDSRGSPLRPVEELVPHHRNQTQQEGVSSMMVQLRPPTEGMSSNVSSDSTSQLIQANQENLGHVLQHVEASDVHVMKPVDFKTETQQTKLDEDLPKQLILMEFRSLMVSVPPKTKQQQVQSNGFVKNFKRFRKMRVPGTEDIIGGPNLLAHNRGKNSEIDEWLKETEEDEQQSRLEESQGDDLFRYNPTKLSKRR
ncbi:nibrin [Corythoichthys intestinalis]|uniref:nibrin n=1 Tax=Corythoichthys intestinalis TaxID=161448 RepID=UPI0025A5FEFB|nr:nibrin [Corythoichthys intestinalis]